MNGLEMMKKLTSVAIGLHDLINEGFDGSSDEL